MTRFITSFSPVVSVSKTYEQPDGKQIIITSRINERTSEILDEKEVVLVDAATGTETDIFDLLNQMFDMEAFCDAIPWRTLLQNKRREAI